MYYQGTTDAKAPVQTTVDYELDGKKMNAGDLEGKSGHLKMTVHLKNTVSKTVQENGKDVIIHPAFLAGGLTMLDNAVFTNVKCDLGKVINDADKQILVFATVPGLLETMNSAGLAEEADDLKLSDDIVIEADVKDFQSETLYVAMTSKFDLDDIPELDQISDLTGMLNPLFSAYDQIQDGAHQLADGAGQLEEGAAPLGSAGSSIETLKNAFAQLDDGAGQLESGIGQYTGGVSALYAGSGSACRSESGSRRHFPGCPGQFGSGFRSDCLHRRCASAACRSRSAF